MNELEWVGVIAATVLAGALWLLIRYAAQRGLL